MNKLQNSDAENNIGMLTNAELERMLENTKSPEQQHELADKLEALVAKLYSPNVNNPDTSPA